MSTFGYFDDANREYVITRPDTPQPWTNYSGDRTYGGIFSNHATGYSFTHSPATGRLLRYAYTQPQGTQAGRYFYLRDAEDGDFWSSSWLPVAKPLDAYQSTTRMGMGTVAIESRYREIKSTSTYFIPLGLEFEYWILELENTGTESRNLDLFSYAEFTSVWDIMHDAFNQQYANAISCCKWEDGMASGGNMPNLPVKEEFGERHQSRWWYMLQAGDLQPESYELERDAFLGPQGNYAAPQAVINGHCGKSECYGDTACVALQSKLTLAPGEKKSVVMLLGPGRAEKAGKAVRKQYGSIEAAHAELQRLKDYWAQRTSHLKVKTPDPAFDSMINVWGAYNAMMTFEWSRSCSLVYTGQDRDGYGFRDTVQDIMGVVSSIPEECKSRLKLMLSGQESLGGAQPVVDPVFFKEGQMPRVDPAIQRADDCLWFFNSIPSYVAESGDQDFYQEVIPYADGGEATVYGHLRQAIVFSLNHRGPHGLACGLKADWNDCIILGFTGESVFVSMQLRMALEVFAGLAEKQNQPADREWARTELAALDQALQTHAWDGEWFARAFTEAGDTFGSKNSPEGQIFLNPQSWSVISGTATPDQARKAMDQVEKQLTGPHGLTLHASAYKDTSLELMHAVVYLQGAKENAGIFQHTQGWAVMADCMLGNGDRAYRNFRAYLPSAQNEHADLREVEPYVYAQWTHAPESPKAGRSRVPWLSGTAAWSYYAATRHILGLQAEDDGLRINPCIPSKWESLEVERVYRGKRIRVQIENPKGLQQGVQELRLESGEVISGNLLPLAQIEDSMTVTALLE